MVQLPVYNAAGETVDTYDIDADELAPRINKQLLHDAVVMYQASQRQGSFRTKSRARVAGSTQKMFRQKGTGRARAGSSRTNVRRGGGMAFAKGEEDLLTSILDPSAAVAPEYANYLVETADGELLDGILRTETAVSVTLARANGETDTIERSRIQSISTEGRSLMPDGLEQGLDASGLADLLAYLRQHDH